MKLRGLEALEHFFRVPLDHADPTLGERERFAREVRAPGAGASDRPWLVFLQGGPGFESPRPLGTGGWIGRAVERYRVLLLDQRGTGRSTAQLGENVAQLEGEAQADHLARFRADSIVRDLERVREARHAVLKHIVLGEVPVREGHHQREGDREDREYSDAEDVRPQEREAG